MAQQAKTPSIGSLSDGDSLVGSDSESALQLGADSVNDSDNMSSGYADSVYSGAHGNDGDTVTDSIAKKGTKAACHLRALVIALFIFMSVFVPIVIFRTTTNNEEEGFKNEFEALATKVIDSFEFNVARKLGAIDSLDISVTSYAVGTKSTFPFVTMPDFDLRAANTLALADTSSVFLVPVVKKDLRTQWEEYSVENQDWIDTSLNRNTIDEVVSNRHLQLSGVSSSIYRFDENGNEVREESPDDFFLPIWQNSPVFPDIVNFNLASVDSFRDGILAMIDTEEAVLGRVAEFSSSESVLQGYFEELLASEGLQYDDGPVSSLFYPVFDRFGTNHTLVSLFSTVIFWHTFFEGILPSNAEGIICVVENECGQAFTYQINGQEAAYKGAGDLHDGSFESLGEIYEFTSIQQSDSFTFREASIPLNEEYCPYSLRVYPSEQLQDEFITLKPVIYTACVALAFVLISAVAITYDCVVQRRLKAVLDSAIESRAIVSSLFPANVRDRLFEQDGKKPRKERTLGEALAGDQKDKNKEAHHLAAHPAKLRLKNFLHDGPEIEGDGNGVMQSKPIADLFPHCTVLFADIAGFTAWSSEREPTQVFTLLQTIFHFFDNIARKWGVFKVETIGDCYVAVTGLPDPQADHAVRMTKFARECMRKVTDLTHKLETSLGPDTGDLTMRFGLHSGPVTAGVLRGEKSRFQLFGDTVNTASRMESTGKKSHIQVSQSTADLLVEAGKEAWITPRDDLVSAKGKGDIQTYWVNVKAQRVVEIENALESDDRSQDNSAHSGDNTPGRKSVALTKSVFDMQPMSQNRKLKRLVDWQTDILARLLKPIIAQRDRKSASKFLNKPANALPGVGDCILDEVADTLILPKFDPTQAKSQVNPNSVELSPAAMTQLRDYVTAMAESYHENPFHNFEHASHVTMSASKLLNRIVIPEDVNYQRKSVKAIASDLHDYTYGITSDPLTQFAVIFCSLIHDADHHGVSNFQVGQERPDMAEKYKRRSILEQNSIDLAWDMLMKPEYRNLQQCIFTNEEELLRFRQLVVNLVMATDIFDKEMKTLRDSRWDRAFHRAADAPVLSEEETTNVKATIVIEHIIQAADVAHTMQHWHVYTKWNERLFNEMYLAYEMGRSPKDPSEGWAKGELWFFDNYVIPLAKKLDECHVFGVASDEGLNYALANRAEWAVKGDAIVVDMLERYKANKAANSVENK